MLDDDPVQAEAARSLISDATSIVMPIAALCEFVWVAAAGYRLTRDAIVQAVEALIASEGAVYDEGAVRAGLQMLRIGGDFADGVISYDGRRLGGEVFVTFDRKAASRVKSLGIEAHIPFTEH